jgi:hypothetical protein
MDVHGTKLGRALFTIATGWSAVPPNEVLQQTEPRRAPAVSTTPAARLRS